MLTDLRLDRVCGWDRLPSRMSNCPFCDPEPASVWLECSSASALWGDRYPVSEGHTLIIPRRHVSRLFDLPHHLVSVWEFVAHVRAELMNRFTVDSFNV